MIERSEGGNRTLPQAMRVRASCALYLVAAWGVMFFAWFNVESIVCGFPVLVGLGIVVIALAMRRSSWLLLNYGISSFWIVGGLSLLIAVFDLSPGQAQPVVPVFLTLYALSLIYYAFALNPGMHEVPTSVVQERPIRFSMKSILIVTSVVCVMAALGRLIAWNSEMWIFGSGGFALMGISGVLLYRFALRMKQFRMEEEEPPIDASVR